MDKASLEDSPKRWACSFLICSQARSSSSFVPSLSLVNGRGLGDRPVALGTRAIESQHRASGVVAVRAFKASDRLGHFCAGREWLHLASAFWTTARSADAHGLAEAARGTAEAERQISHFRSSMNAGF